MKKCMVLAIATFFILSLSFVCAQSRDKGIFVSPTTGVPVNSVWGVFVGISEYKQKDLNLSYADKDAKALHSFFSKQFVGKINKDHFKLLLNANATRRNVLKSLQEVLNRAMEQDLVIISMSMHGMLDMSGRSLYFLTHDTNPNELWDRGLGQQDIVNMIARSKARKIVMLLDTCNSGGFGSNKTLLAMKNVNTGDVNRLLSAMGKSQDGIAVITSSSAAERSQEGRKFCGGHGAFTCSLLTGLKGSADSNRNGLIEVRELFDYTYRNVKQSTDGIQNPNIEGRYDNGLPLAATRTSMPQGYRAEETKKVAKLQGNSGPQDLAPIAVPKNVGGSVNWGLQNDWADTVAYEEKEYNPAQKKAKWLAFAKKWESESDYVSKARDRAKQWGSLAAAYTKTDKAWIATKKNVKRTRIPIETRHNAVADILNTAPAGWSHRSEAQTLLEKLKNEKNKPKEKTRVAAFPSGPGHRTSGKAGVEWVQIPGGSFRMGSTSGGFDEKPVHKVSVSSFRMLKTEVTLGQFKACVAAGACKEKNRRTKSDGKYCNWGYSDRGNHPINCVDWYGAKDFCEWVGGRLPSEAEWEYAASGGEGRKYPWGSSSPNCQYAVMDDSRTKGSAGSETDGCGEDRTWPVCSKPAGHSKHGLCDMAGNVWEWVSDWYGSDYYESSPSRNPRGPSSGSARVVRGGSWLRNDPVNLRSADRYYGDPANRSYVIGFRCVSSSH